MDTNIEDAENQLFTYYALQIVTYIALPMVLSNAIKLKLLASYSIVTCIQQDCESKPVRVYGLAPVAKLFIKNEDGASLGPMLELHQNKLNIDTW
ncbi:caffeic acid 3-O-methyltransferase [Artemisia annua]|uniref:Caffeic acid 3-O-methyltransferase n=1 Tax=Artemisia annua TaxID=35608 RepID=A0A2U1K9Y7_ARTAN|nr:caffeic acid 3-O-methyltransferase [Artemisia annua]